MNSKPFYASKTFWGIVLMAIGPALKQAGLQFSDAEIQSAAELLGAVVGGAVGVWGRLSATKKLTVPGAAGPAGLCLLLALGLALSGCASNKSTTTIYGPDGKTPIQTIVNDQTDAAKHNQAREAVRLAALKDQKPIGRIVIPDGATLKAEGGDITFEVNVPTPEHMVNWAQYREPWLEAAERAGNVLTTGILGYILGFGDNFQRGSAGPVNYNQNVSGGSQAGVSGGGAVGQTITQPPVTVIPPVVVTGQ